jgi:DNA-binding NarL/FixJ family response regulator
MRVVIVEDEKLFLNAIAEALLSRSIDVVARAANLEEARRAVNDSAPDAALLDIKLSPAGTDEGLRVAEELRRRYPEVGLLVLSAHAEVAYAERLLKLEERSRSIGYLLKDRVGNVDELVDALNRVTKGEVVIDPSIIDRLMTRRRRQDPLEALNPHERRVLSLVAEGRSNLGIAQLLGVKISTVEKKLADINIKLGLPVSNGLDRREANVRVLATLTFLRSSGGAPAHRPGAGQE